MPISGRQLHWCESVAILPYYGCVKLAPLEDLNFGFLWSVGYLIIIIIIEVIIFWIIVFVFEQLWLSRVKYAFPGVICPARTSRPMLWGLEILKDFFSSPFFGLQWYDLICQQRWCKKMHQLSKVALHTESAWTQPTRVHVQQLLSLIWDSISVYQILLIFWYFMNVQQILSIFYCR